MILEVLNKYCNNSLLYSSSNFNLIIKKDTIEINITKLHYIIKIKCIKSRLKIHCFRYKKFLCLHTQ